MLRRTGLAAMVIGILVFSTPTARADDEAVERGRTALFTRTFTLAGWSPSAYDNAWKQWEPKPDEQPKDYAQAFLEHYGMHSAPFDNGRYPMGLREGKMFLGGKGLASDCLMCHAGSIMGKSHVGLGNSTLDIQALFEDLARATAGRGNLPFTFSNVRGTSEAGAFAVYLLQMRNPDLSLRLTNKLDLGMRPNLCEDVPAWWLLKKKKTMYHTGTAHARSVRSIMQFMLTPDNGLAAFNKEEPTFADIQQFIFSLEPPKYPFAIDRPRAAKGQTIFNKTCAQCHGTYGEKWSYPNKIVPMDIIGTDRTRFEGFSPKLGEHYNKSWFAQEKPTPYPASEPKGYQAPPLDGVWATAPYFHNGSVPTLHEVLNSKARPKIFTRSFKTDEEAYDKAKVGWKVEVLEQGADPKASLFERRKVYDTTQPGRGNGGHSFGDDFTDAQRRAVIEYLKTL